ncbi:MAG: phosphatidylserine/phosphatidylglycerophosphate/cardiolipin synthase family protein [Candidatus Nanoarchaeia archaeon]|nr:phosphatidylserine/phosphatidylglycerophosphate/cardiolipin synthase family protein [Candidatus Nanoarchaeia archaeon]
MKYELIIDSSNFFSALKKDVLNSKHNFFLQTLSFEGDSVGQKFKEIILKKNRNIDIKILIDDFHHYFVDDKFIFSNFLNKNFIYQYKKSNEIVKDFKQNNIQFKFTNIVGIFLNKLISRNHKKIYVIDNNIAYIGGINICEHNFMWHDLMLRINDKNIANFIKNDFESTWNNKSKPKSELFDDLELISVNGKNNKFGFKKILNLVDSAKKEIWVISSYLTNPFLKKLKKASEKKIKINIISSEKNNYPMFKDLIKKESKKNGFNLFLYKPRMNHMKAILIDKKYLILGSSCFDFMSYNFHSEIFAIITNKGLIRDFTKKVITQDLKVSDKIL